MARRVPAKLLAAIKAAGWTVDRTGGDHWRFTPPPGTRSIDGRVAPAVIMSSSGSDVRGVRNTISRLRRCGVVIDTKVGR